MTFSTKSSRDHLAHRMSSRANVTFKTISLFGTHDGERIRCPTSNMHPNMRRFYCTARCWLSLMQVDRSLCMTTMCVGMSRAFCQELPEGTHKKYTGGLSGSDRKVAGSLALGAAARFPSPERCRRSRLKPETGVHV